MFWETTVMIPWFTVKFHMLNSGCLPSLLSGQLVGLRETLPENLWFQVKIFPWNVNQFFTQVTQIHFPTLCGTPPQARDRVQNLGVCPQQRKSSGNGGAIQGAFGVFVLSTGWWFGTSCLFPYFGNSHPTGGWLWSAVSILIPYPNFQRLNSDSCTQKGNFNCASKYQFNGLTCFFRLPLGAVRTIGKI